MPRVSFPAAPASERKHAVQAQTLMRQLVGVERFVAVQAGQFHFGRGREPQIGAFEMKHVRREFRQLADAGERRGVDDKRRQNFRVAVLARVHVEKEIRDGALEPRAQALVNGEPRSGNFHRRLLNPEFRRLRQPPSADAARNRISAARPSGALPRCRPRPCPPARSNAEYSERSA